MIYRLYVFGPDGHIKMALNLLHETDEEALAAVEQAHASEQRAMELWQLMRLVRRFPVRPSV